MLEQSLPWQAIYDDIGVETPPYDDTPLGGHVETHARERGDNIALQYFDRGISFRELNERANRLANALAARGVGKGDVVGIHLPNVPQYAVALVAISKIGCIGSGVSPLLAPGEIAYQVENACISVLITLSDLAPAIQQIPELPICLKTIIVTGATDLITAGELEVPTLGDIQSESYLAITENESAEFRQRPVHWNDTFMIQYTGGTTGKPKGAEISVRNLLYNTVQSAVYVPWEIGSEVAATAFPMFHTAGLCYHVASMRFAACALLIPDPRNVEFFCQQMARFPPTRIAAVPTLYQMLVAHRDIGNVDFSMLKHAVTGAAPLTSEDRTRINAVLGEDRLSDAFGMTETGPVHVMNPPMCTKPTSVGIPVPGAETRIVDLETGTKEMPFGEAGEIVTAGPQVMKGYLNLPEESAKALREWRGKTWMYTGDVGYMDEDGYIYLCDRAKDMLIVGGFKVFSVEVEDKLQSLDFIAQCAVIATPDEKRPGNDVVNLYVELEPESKDMEPVTVEREITAFCHSNMAPYKVPKVIHLIDEIPLTPIGKIDKKVLRSQAAS
ncbi:MAG: class I adenylate-forming enzyme family protein [Woeseiaceae bacterium]